MSIYTLSDLCDLSNLIGSQSRTIQQYSPPSEWILGTLSKDDDDGSENDGKKMNLRSFKT